MSQVNIERLKQFVAEYGTDVFPKNRSGVSNDERRLAHWRYYLIRMDREDRLSDELRKQVEAIHPSFLDTSRSFTKRTFEQIIDDLAAFHKEHGRLPVQRSQGEKDENYKAISGLSVRRKFRDGQLTEQEIRYINSKVPELLLNPPARRNPNQEQRLKELEEWYKLNDHRPRHWIEEEQDLAFWVNNKIKSPELKSPKAEARRKRVIELVGASPEGEAS